MASSKKDPQPKVPESQQFDPSSLMKSWEDFYKPQSSADYMDMYSQMMARYPQDFDTMMGSQLNWFPQVLSAQRQAQGSLYDNLQYHQQQWAPANAAVGNKIAQTYSPEFFSAYSALGNRINEGLASGYDLGEGLSKEMEQSIRGAQMARGNWLGPAPTAQEAFGKGQAALDLYNTRLGQAQNFIQGNNPLNMSNQAWSAFSGQPYYPSQSYLDTGVGASMVGQVGNQAGNVFSSIGQQQGNYNSALGSAQGAYNNALLGANDQNNNWMYQNYDRTADAWSYREAARQGLYSTPQVGGGGGGMMGGIGSMVGGVAGGVGTAVSGLAAAGVIGGGAAAAGAGGAAAAASAAASALCWLARKLIPDQWKSFRKWLFTKAPDEVRRDYIFNARRLANAIT